MECRGKYCEHLGTDKSCVFNVPIFQGVTIEEANLITKAMTSKTIPKGKKLFEVGDEINLLYVIHVGKVKIYRISEDGKEQIIRILGSKDFIGELSLFSSTISKNIIEAMTNTYVCVIEPQKLKGIILEHPQIAIKILSKMSDRIDLAENLIEQLGMNDAQKRIASYLVQQSDSQNEINLSMSKTDLASYLGTTKETLSRKLTLFQNNGWIKQEGQRKITITDKNGLNSLI